jgi:hypothetical protein
MEFGELSENPFSMQKPPPLRERKAFFAAIKFLLLVAVCLGGTVVIGSQSRQWLVQYLVSDFDSLSPEDKQVRLTQVAELGLPGIDPLVEAMAEADVSVARTAYELLEEVQGQWNLLGDTDRRRHYHALIESLETIAVHLPDDRTGWGTSLLQPAVSASVDRRDDASRKLYRRANHVTDMLSLSQRAGPSVLIAEPIAPAEPRRLAVRSKPISNRQRVQDADRIELQSAQSDSIRHTQAGARIFARSTDIEINVPNAAESSIYRSGRALKLQPTEGGEDIVLRGIGQSKETSYQAKPIHSVAHVVDSPVETLDDQSVMLWLGSPHTQMRDKAKAELISRGFGETAIAIATQIAVGDTPSRLALVDAISRSESIDPRPWLLMLLDDQNRQVKLRAISVLATMKDAYVDQRLRKQLAEERDTVVSEQIHRVLELR